MKHICIYCKQEKEETDFNTEHVIPQMFGTYPGKAPVLNQYQVCRECNSFFSRELEDKIALDSIEALSRMQYGTKRISDGRQLRGKRLKVEISEGILKGISPQIVSNNNSPERIEFQYNKLIGPHKGGAEDEYEYYTCNNLPEATPDIIERLKKVVNPIVVIGLSENETRPLLTGLGYIKQGSPYKAMEPKDLIGDSEEIKVSFFDVVDPIKKRLAAKAVLNFLCYKYGPSFALQEKLDPIRNYIRYGTWDSSHLRFRIKDQPREFCDLPNIHSHAIGWAWEITNTTSYLVGIVTWFGNLSQEFILYEDKDAFSLDYDHGTITYNRTDFETIMLYADNEKRALTEENSWFIIQCIGEMQQSNP